MTIDVVIPSLHRREKLDNCLNTLFLANGLDSVTVHLYLSDQVEYYHYWAYFCAIKDRVVVHYLPREQYKVPEFWNSHLRTLTSDMLLTMNDDCEFHKDTFISILEEFPKQFPDMDGLMGICQSNAIDEQGFEGAFTVIGRKYADRFPNRQVWPTDYFRLKADLEMTDYAKSINKFYFSSKCKIIHWHPAFGGKIDSTHIAVREYRQKDNRTYQIRKSKGYLWGKNFEIINK